MTKLSNDSHIKFGFQSDKIVKKFYTDTSSKQLSQGLGSLYQQELD